MRLTDIRYAYLEGRDIAEINEMYKKDLDGISEELQLEVWKQVCAFANVEMIDYLLSIGWRAMGIEDDSGNTLLHILASAEFDDSYFIGEDRIYEATKKLLEAKVSPLRKNNYSETALMIGAKSGYHEMLIAYGECNAKTDFTTKDGNTLLHIVAQNSAHLISRFETAKENLEYNYQQNFDENNAREVQKRAELEWRYNTRHVRLTQCISFVYGCFGLEMDPYQKNNAMETAVDVAVNYKSKIIGAVLAGADFNDEEKSTLYVLAGGQNVYQACINRDAEGLNALIQLGENINEEYDKEGDRYHGMTPLSIAVVLHDANCVEVLLKNGADAMFKDSKSWHPFRYLYSPESSIQTNSDQFKNKNFQRMLQAFLEAGFDINSFLDDDENTLLTLSAKYSDRTQMFNNDTIPRTFINEAIFANADVNKTNREGISALMYLCLTGFERAEKEILTILEQGASTTLKDKNGKTALIYATQNDDKATAKTYCELLAEFGDILIDAKDNSEKTALDYAVEKNNENLVAWLLGKQ